MTNYQPVMQRIYCGAKNVDLSKEHILMFGLGGKEVLPNASCAECAKVTSRIELDVARKMWGGFRAKTGMPSRRSKIVTEFDLTVAPLSQGAALFHRARTVPVSINSLPAALTFPKIPMPVMLTGVSYETYDAWSAFFSYEELQKWKNHRVYVGEINLQLFCRFLAKTAHALMCAEHGVNGFSPILPDVILGRCEGASDFVGILNPELPKEEHLHRMQTVDISHNGLTYMGVLIRLFANFGAPEYLVVGGYRLSPA